MHDQGETAEEPEERDAANADQAMLEEPIENDSPEKLAGTRIPSDTPSFLEAIEDDDLSQFFAKEDLLFLLKKRWVCKYMLEQRQHCKNEASMRLTWWFDNQMNW